LLRHVTLEGMNDRGNAFLYILIAIVLFAALTYALVRNHDAGGAASEIDEGRVAVAADAILAYAVSTQTAISQMDRMGTTADEIDFILPSEATFNDTPTLDKLFHPDGGGLIYKPLPKDAIDSTVTSPAAGFYVGQFNNFEWSPTTAQDVIFSAYGLTETVCARLNRQITGDPAIPEVQGISLQQALADASLHTSGNADIDSSSCADCEEKPALCIHDGSKYGFYSVMVAQ
jgi:hypothetical protein